MKFGNNPWLYRGRIRGIGVMRTALAFVSPISARGPVMCERSKRHRTRVVEASSAKSGVVGSMRKGVLAPKILPTGQYDTVPDTAKSGPGETPWAPDRKSKA